MAVRSQGRHAFQLAIVLVGIAVVGPMTTDAFGDGAFFKEQGYKKAVPAMPSQRAIIAFADGQQRLVVESSLDGEGQAFGWIIPVPAAPTELEETSPGLLETLSLNLQPKMIRYSRKPPLQVALLLPIFVAIWAICAIITGKVRPWLLLLAIPLAILFSVPGPKSQYALEKRADGGPGGIEPGVRVERSETIGNYEVAVLEADSADDLDAWLSANGFAGLPDEGVMIAQDYVDEGWHFVAAKLRRDGTGLSRAHPLTMTFPAEQPIYPMRLTALAGSDLYLKLFVFAEGMASHDELALEFSDTFVPDTAEPGSGYAIPNYERLEPLESSENPDPTGHPVLRPDWFPFLHIAHPELAGCHEFGPVITKLTGILTPAQMEQDFVLELQEPRPRQQHLYSERAARRETRFWVALAWAVSAAVVMLPFSRRLGGKRARIAALVVVLAIPLAAAVTTQSVCDARLARGDMTLQMPDESASHSYDYGLASMASNVACAHDGFAGWTDKEIQQTLERHFTYSALRNRVFDRPLAFDACPGDILIERDDRGVVVKAFDVTGVPEEVVFGGNATAKQEESLEEPWWTGLDAEEGRERMRDYLWRQINPPQQVVLNHDFAVREEQAVGPLISSLDAVSRQDRPYLQMVCQHLLPSATGYDFSDRGSLEEQVTLWQQWWEHNKGKSRLEWLQDAWHSPAGCDDIDFLAVELAYLGDDRGILRLKELLDSGGSTEYFVAAASLAKLGREEGFAELAMCYDFYGAADVLADIGTPRALATLLVYWERLGSYRVPEPSAALFRLMYQFIEHQEETFPLLLQHLAKTRNGEMRKFAASTIGIITEIVPPANVGDEAAVQAFVAKANAWWAEKER